MQDVFVCEIKKADAEFRWFVRTYTQRSNDDKDIKDPEELALVGRAATEYANSDKELTDQFDFILNTMYKDALKEDPDAWYIEQAAGTLLLEKYNRGEALDAFDKALVINPNCAEALVGKGHAVLEGDVASVALEVERITRWEGFQTQTAPAPSRAS